MPSRLTVALAVVIASGSAAVSTACTSGDLAVGATSQALKNKKDGTPSGTGSTCSWDGVDNGTSPTPDVIYNVGDTFKSLDGCNDCSCSAQGIMCTERACAGAPPGSSGTGAVCTYHGHTWKPGDSVPMLDGCNATGCTEDGTLASTLMACEYTCPAQTVIDCEPIVPEERLALCYGTYHDWIVNNCPGVGFAL